MSGIVGDFVVARARAFDGMIQSVELHVAPEAHALVGVKSANLFDAVLGQASLTAETAWDEAWTLLGRGLRRLRDSFPRFPDGDALPHAASDASMRNARIFTGYHLRPPELPHPAGPLSAMSDPEIYARHFAARMVNLAAADIADSRAEIEKAVRSGIPLVQTPEHVPGLDLSDGPRGAGRVLRAAFVAPAAAQGLTRAQEFKFVSQMRISAGLLQDAYSEACTEFSRHLGPRNLAH